MGLQSFSPSITFQVVSLHPILVASSLFAPALLPSLQSPPLAPTATTATLPRPPLPPFLHRVGFAVAFGAASYVLATGDTRNGSGISTGVSPELTFVWVNLPHTDLIAAWSLTYLFLHLRNTLRPPRHPAGLALAGSVSGCAALFGTEYFYFQN